MRLPKFIIGCTFGLLLAAPTLARGLVGLHWERMHVYHAEPSQVFARLGLTHSTRYGHTLGQKRIPDPTFPPGLTDVVPYDPSHTLLVRGTAAGVAEFRRRVAAVDVPEPRWQVSLTLLRPDPNAGGTGQALARQTEELIGDTPLIIAFDPDGTLPQYQITAHANPDGTITLTHQRSLSLTPLPAATPGVFVPAQIWTRAATDTTHLGSTCSFSDLAVDRVAARQQIGQPADDQNGDYQVQIQITPEPPVSDPDAPVAPAAGGGMP